MPWILIIAAIAILDQATKYLIMKNLSFSDSITVIKDFFYIVRVENTGAAMGMLQNGRYFLVPATAVIGIIVSIALVKAESVFLKISLSFILGGALGNFIDRVFRGRVTDFLDFHIGSFRFWTFNLADVFIVVGTIMLAAYILFFYKESQESKAATEGLKEADGE